MVALSGLRGKYLGDRITQWSCSACKTGVSERVPAAGWWNAASLVCLGRDAEGGRAPHHPAATLNAAPLPACNDERTVPNR